MTSIVDTPAAPATPDGGGDRDAIESIYQRVLEQGARFIGELGGEEWYSPFALALVIHEIVTDHTAAVVPDLVRELGTADGEVRRVVDLLVAALDANDRLREDNDRLRAELHSREPVT